MSSDGQYRLLKVINQNAFGLLMDETRSRIVRLLQENELSVGEIAKALDLTPQNVYHHIRKLHDVGLIAVKEEKRSGHLIESYYTTTADTFLYYTDQMNESDTQAFLAVLSGLNELGYGMELNEKNARSLTDIQQKRVSLMGGAPAENEICPSCSFSGYFMKFGPMNPLLLSRIIYYSNLMRLSDEDFEKSLDLTKQLRKTLLSMKTKSDAS